MTIQRMDHVGIVVDDLASAKAFFVELGLKVQGEWSAEGGWVDGVVGLEGVRSQIAMLGIPDGHGRLELSKFHAPSVRGRRPARAGEHRSPACGRAAGSSLARWRTTKTSIGSAMSAARRGSSSSWRSESAEGSVGRRA